MKTYNHIECLKNWFMVFWETLCDKCMGWKVNFFVILSTVKPNLLIHAVFNIENRLVSSVRGKSATLARQHAKTSYMIKLTLCEIESFEKLFIGKYTQRRKETKKKLDMSIHCVDSRHNIANIWHCMQPIPHSKDWLQRRTHTIIRNGNKYVYSQRVDFNWFWCSVGAAAVAVFCLLVRTIFTLNGLVFVLVCLFIDRYRRILPNGIYKRRAMIFYLTIYCKTVQSTAQIEVLSFSLSVSVWQCRGRVRDGKREKMPKKLKYRKPINTET